MSNDILCSALLIALPIFTIGAYMPGKLNGRIEAQRESIKTIQGWKNLYEAKP